MADKNYDIDDDFVYNENIREMQKSDKANAETVFNPLFLRIINNSHALQRDKANKTELTAEANERVSSDNALSLRIDEAKSIAEGRSQARVFATYVEMTAWLAVSANKEKLNVGDDFYIIDVNVPDYWWDGTQARASEAEKVDLTDYFTKEQVNALLVSKASLAELTNLQSTVNGKANAQHTHLGTDIIGLLSNDTNGTSAKATALTREGEDGKKLDGLSNENIIINRDLRNPINQRMQDTYKSDTGTINTIDMWRAEKSLLVSVIKNKGVRLSNNDTVAHGFLQYLEPLELLLGETFTFSVKTDEDIYFATGTASDIFVSHTDVCGITTPFEKIHFYMGVSRFIVRIVVNAGKTVDVERVKLELGSISTLASDPPQNYGVELSKCQRYFLRCGYEYDIAKIGTGYTMNDSAIINVPTPTTLRIKPTIITSTPISNIVLQTSPAGSQTPITSISVDGFSQNSVQLRVYATGLTGGFGASLRLASFTYIDFDANL